MQSFANRFGVFCGLMFLGQLVAASPTTTVPAGDVYVPVCFTRQRPPPGTTNNRTPRPQDVANIIRQFQDEDTRRPPEIASFSPKGTSAAQSADFQLPLIKRHVTAISTLGMLSRCTAETSYAFMYRVTDTIQQIVDVCSQERDWVGGLVAMNEEMAVSIRGINPFSSSGVFSSGNDTTGGQLEDTETNEQFSDQLIRWYGQQTNGSVEVA